MPRGKSTCLFTVPPPTASSRHRVFPRVKPLGMSAVPALCCFTSEEALSFYSSCKKICHFIHHLESLLHQKCRCRVGHWRGQLVGKEDERTGAGEEEGGDEPIRWALPCVVSHHPFIGFTVSFNIQTDSAGRMIPEALEDRIVKSKEEVGGGGGTHAPNRPSIHPSILSSPLIHCQGFFPFFVCATAGWLLRSVRKQHCVPFSGTTVYGAWDPLIKISEICRRHGIWLHVDVRRSGECVEGTFCQIKFHPFSVCEQAAWGGGLLLSPEHRHKLDGIEQANSVTWNPHKLMGASLQCSACFVREEVKLKQLDGKKQPEGFHQN